MEYPSSPSRFLRSLENKLQHLGADKTLSYQNHPPNEYRTNLKSEYGASSRTHELMRGLELKADALLRELAAIQIQKRVRGFLVRRRHAFFLFHREWELQLSTALSYQLIDEFCTQTATRISFDVMKSMGIGLSGAFHQDSDISTALDDIVEDVLVETSRSVVIEAIKENTQSYLRNRPNYSSNPIVALIMSLCSEASDEIAKQVAKGAVKELTDEYLEGLQTQAIFSHIATSYTRDISLALVTEAQKECEEEGYMDVIINDVVGSYSRSVALEILDTVKREWEEALRREDERQITACFQRTVGKRLAVVHLMLSISNGFEAVLLEYKARSIVKRMIAQRLVHILHQTQQVREGLKDSLFLCDIVSSVLNPPLQEKLIEKHWELFEDTLENIDKMEKDFFSSPRQLGDDA